MEKHISAPLSDETVNELKSGDYVYITGVIYTARDAAHKRMNECLIGGENESSSDGEAGNLHEENGDDSVKEKDCACSGQKSLPFDLKNNIIYYMGPSPAREGRVIGSAGPTTSSRMDKYTPALLDLGLKGMIGKGRRGKEVKESIVKNNAVYFAAVGGAGALLSKCITRSEVIAYDDLGTEAIRKLTVENFPAIVVIDNKGNDLYEDING